jgi:hypothetical protein
MTLQKRNRGFPSEPRPCRCQLGNLGTLYSQALHDRGARRPQLCAIAVQRVKVEAVFAAIPVADLGRVRRHVGLLVAQRLASPYVRLGVLDGKPALGEALGNV